MIIGFNLLETQYRMIEDAVSTNFVAFCVNFVDFFGTAFTLSLGRVYPSSQILRKLFANLRRSLREI